MCVASPWIWELPPPSDGAVPEGAEPATGVWVQRDAGMLWDMDAVGHGMRALQTPADDCPQTGATTLFSQGLYSTKHLTMSSQNKFSKAQASP